MWTTVDFMGAPTRAWMASPDLWDSYAKVWNAGARPSNNHVLVCVDVDSPYRWLRLITLADKDSASQVMAHLSELRSKEQWPLIHAALVALGVRATINLGEFADGNTDQN